MGPTYWGICQFSNSPVDPGLEIFIPYVQSAPQRLWSFPLSHCVNCLLLTGPSPHFPCLDPHPHPKPPPRLYQPSGLLPSLHWNVMCILLPDFASASKGVMSEIYFWLKFSLCTSLYSQKETAKKSFEKEITLSYHSSICNLQANLITKFCKLNSIHWHPRNIVSCPNCKPPCSLWIANNDIFSDKTNILYSHFYIFLQC